MFNQYSIEENSIEENSIGEYEGRPHAISCSRAERRKNMRLLSEQAEKQIKQEITYTVIEAVKDISKDLQPLYLKKYQVCELLNISNKSLDDLIRQGLPKTKISNNITRYNRDAVLQWIHDYNKAV
jgi:hypothetical protein